MNGLAIICGVRPDEVCGRLGFFNSLKDLHPTKMIQIRHELTQQQPNSWLANAAYGIALISWSKLTQEQVKWCEKNAGDGARCVETPVQWVSAGKSEVSRMGWNHVFEEPIVWVN